MEYDVVIPGASIAGCAAATVYGRAGLRVALLDRARDPCSHKVLCGHLILGGTHDTLHRLGFWPYLVQAGAAVTDRMAVWTSAGWILPPPDAGIPPGDQPSA